MKLNAGLLFLVLVLLTACGGAQPSRTAEIQLSAPSIYTGLGKPDGLNGSVSRMDKDGQTCYCMWGGTGVSVSCPATQKTHSESASDIVYTDLGKPDGLNGRVVEMRDGDQLCYLIWGGTQVDISCP